MMMDMDYVVSTERLGWPGDESSRFERSGLVQCRLVYPTQSDLPTASCHVQQGVKQKALCGHPSETLIEVPGHPTFDQVDPELRCGKCDRLLRELEDA